ncbi:MAG: MerR family transcriptional regulator [Bythopirellula sp.]|nr:MerR family transcriptional regulator [Bythopirellula sp.]
MLLPSNETDPPTAIMRLYTPAMLAELLDVPVAAIRRWQRRGFLQASQTVRRLSYFDFAEVGVARHLAALLLGGCSLQAIDRKLAEFARHVPELARPLADPAVVVVGRQLFLRRGEELSEPGGQLLIDFDAASEEEVASLDFSSYTPQVAEPPSVNELQITAQDWEDQGDLVRAAEAYRLLLAFDGPSAEANFALGDLLYRMGDLTAARERFYVAVELDEEYVEARANLGCVLAENGELDLAVAAFQGALSFHADYADVHYHLASALDRLDRRTEAEGHWWKFLSLAPESPWAETAKGRLGG